MGPITHGILCFITPDFSAAISSISFPITSMQYLYVPVSRLGAVGQSLRGSPIHPMQDRSQVLSNASGQLLGAAHDGYGGGGSGLGTCSESPMEVVVRGEGRRTTYQTHLVRGDVPRTKPTS